MRKPKTEKIRKTTQCPQCHRQIAASGMTAHRSKHAREAKAASTVSISKTGAGMLSTTNPTPIEAKAKLNESIIQSMTRDVRQLYRLTQNDESPEWIRKAARVVLELDGTV